MVKKGFFKYIGIVPVFTVSAILLLAGAYNFKLNYDSNILGLRKVTNGLHICFSRVQQTYTSSLLRTNNSQYLENDFHMSTEECFGEVVNTLAAEVNTSFSVINNKLNSLAKEVHWFHNKIEFKDGKLIKGSGFALDRRFTALEEIFDSLTERIERRITNQENLSERTLYIMIGIIALMLLTILFSTYKDYGLRKEAEELDYMAEIELDKDNISPKKAFNLFRKMSSIFSSDHCEELAQKMNMQANRAEYSFVDDYSELKTPSSSENLMPVEPIVFDLDEDEQSSQMSLGITDFDQEVETHKDSEWKEFDHSASTQESVTEQPAEAQSETPILDKETIKTINLDAVLANTVKAFVSDFFRQGIEIDFKVDQATEIIADQEAVDQILHNILGSALNLSTDVTKVFIESHKEKDATVLEIRDNSKQGFAFNFVDNQDNLAYPHESSYIGLILCKELVKDIEANIQFENLYASDGEIIGTLRIVRFKSPEKKMRLAYVRKATKAELLKSFNA